MLWLIILKKNIYNMNMSDEYREEMEVQKTFEELGIQREQQQIHFIDKIMNGDADGIEYYMLAQLILSRYGIDNHILYWSKTIDAINDEIIGPIVIKDLNGQMFDLLNAKVYEDQQDYFNSIKNLYDYNQSTTIKYYRRIIPQ